MGPYSAVAAYVRKLMGNATRATTPRCQTAPRLHPSIRTRGRLSR